jgi:hypothetical protein
MAAKKETIWISLFDLVVALLSPYRSKRKPGSIKNRNYDWDIYHWKCFLYNMILRTAYQYFVPRYSRQDGQPLAWQRSLILPPRDERGNLPHAALPSP